MMVPAMTRGKAGGGQGKGKRDVGPNYAYAYALARLADLGRGPRVVDYCCQRSRGLLVHDWKNHVQHIRLSKPSERLFRLWGRRRVMHHNPLPRP